MKNNTNFELDIYFRELENKFPVEQWCISGIYVWPYIRIKLYLFLLSEQINRDKENKVDKTSSISRKKIKNRSFKKTVKLLKAIISHEIFFSKLQRKKIVFVGSHFHRIQEQGFAFNRFFDSMIKSNHLENEVYFLEYQKIIANSYNKKVIINLQKRIDAFRNIDTAFKSKKKSFENDSELYKYDSFLKEVTKEFIKVESLNLEAKNLRNWVKKINSLSNFYIRFFKKVSPDKLIFCGYYAWDNLYAAIYSANKLNIKTIDFQHGPQTNHMVFSDWFKIPESGYNLMPKEYWVWDQESKLNIEKWSADKKDIIVKIAGHPYLQYKKTNDKSVKSAVVFSMQTFPLERMIPKEIITLMKNWSYKWIFRLHPRNSFSISEIENFFDNFGVDRHIYDLELPNEKSLPETFSIAHLHFTGFSGCTLEARSLGVPTILIDPIGSDFFKEYFDEKLIFWLSPKSDDFFEKSTQILNDFVLQKSGQNRSKVINPLHF
ncbi:hypothetical protein [Zunongwangia endophytica]|uniref:Capsule polysaccharide biosynthesis protein n=1 Tax=Zunongwangia endophytica TaxID=1808945 RepID=A0ABV8H5X9_9FLAO|nr:hypothetical protein [Zunongwangia endophytica]MDN3595035.1 hypothetical protein [Zunongwangia endophytica]